MGAWHFGGVNDASSDDTLLGGEFPAATREQWLKLVEGVLKGASFDKKLAADCRSRLTQGYARLDPALSSPRLITAWRLWVPASWKETAA